MLQVLHAYQNITIQLDIKKNPLVYEEYKKCRVRKVLNKKICCAHCKAYPIYGIIHQIVDKSIRYGYEYMHYPSKHIARFAPFLLPKFNFYSKCCMDTGLAFSIPNGKKTVKCSRWQFEHDHRIGKTYLESHH